MLEGLIVKDTTPQEKNAYEVDLVDLSSIVMYNFGVGPRFAFVSASVRVPK
jgi:hypothetical protein